MEEESWRTHHPSDIPHKRIDPQKKARSNPVGTKHSESLWQASPGTGIRLADVAAKHNMTTPNRLANSMIESRRNQTLRIFSATFTGNEFSRIGRERGGGTGADELRIQIISVRIAATRRKGQSEKEREGHRDENGTVSIRLLPIIIHGGGSGGGAIECSVFIHHDTVGEE